MRAALAGLVLVGLAAGCGGTKTVTVTTTATTVRTVTTTATTTASTTPSGSAGAAACTGDALAGRFGVVAGSAGAGNIVYSLRLTNTSAEPCFVSGLPAVTLLGADGTPLPTSVTAAQPGQASAAKIVLLVGGTAKADARFSPDVPGTGEQHSGPCEAKAAVLRVSAPGGGAVAAPVSPPTPVCEHGALSFSLYASTG